MGKKRRGLKKGQIYDMISNEKTGDLMDTGNKVDTKREEILEAIDRLCLLDDNLMTHFKETEGGREIVCQIFEELAEKRGTEEKKAFARRLIARGKQTLEEIAEDTDLPLEEIKTLAGTQLA